jgi:hypothetical protein
MRTETLIEQKTEVDGRLRLLSLYEDFAASVPARWATSTINKLARPRWETSAEMWNLNAFNASQQVRKMMIQNVTEADVLIVALSSLDRCKPKLVDWLDALVDGTAEGPVSGLLICLLGDEDQTIKGLGWTVKQFMRCAQGMGRNFIWHWTGREAINDTTWLTGSVEKFLSRKQPLLNKTWLQATAASLG